MSPRREPSIETEDPEEKEASRKQKGPLWCSLSSKAGLEDWIVWANARRTSSCCQVRGARQQADVVYFGTSAIIQKSSADCQQPETNHHEADQNTQDLAGREECPTAGTYLSAAL